MLQVQPHTQHKADLGTLTWSQSSARVPGTGLMTRFSSGSDKQGKKKTPIRFQRQ